MPLLAIPTLTVMKKTSYLLLPAGPPADARADAVAVVPALCHVRLNQVGMLERRGGKGGRSQLAFRRKFSPGGNLGKLASVDFGKPAGAAISYSLLEDMLCLRRVPAA